MNNGKMNGSMLNISDERTEIVKIESKEYDEVSEDILYENGRNEEKDDGNISLIMDGYFDRKLIGVLSNMYNVNIINKNNDIDYVILCSLIADIIKDGHNSGNAADYLLESEYLSTPNKLYENWISYRNEKYNNNFNQKLQKSLEINMNFEKIICGKLDINKRMGCDVAEYFKEFFRGKTYIHAFWAFIGLSLRTLRYYFRQFFILLFSMSVSILAAVVLGSIYGEMSEEQDDVQNRFGAFGFMCIFLGIQAIASSGTFHAIRDVFIDDRNAKLYGATPFLFARTIPDLILLRIIPSGVFGVIFFEMCAFQEDTFGDFIGVTILLSCASSLCVFAISSLMPDAQIAGFVSIFINMLLIFYGGVFIQDESSIPEWIAWPKELSFYNFAFEILMVNEFTGLSFKIDSAEVSFGGQILSFDADETEVRLSGEFFLGFFGMNPDEIFYDWTMLIVWITIYFIIAWLALELLYRSKR